MGQEGGRSSGTGEETAINIFIGSLPNYLIVTTPLTKSFSN